MPSSTLCDLWLRKLLLKAETKYFAPGTTVVDRYGTWNYSVSTLHESDFLTIVLTDINAFHVVLFDVVLSSCFQSRRGKGSRNCLSGISDEVSKLFFQGLFRRIIPTSEVLINIVWFYWSWNCILYTELCKPLQMRLQLREGSGTLRMLKRGWEFLLISLLLNCLLSSLVVFQGSGPTSGVVFWGLGFTFKNWMFGA